MEIKMIGRMIRKKNLVCLPKLMFSGHELHGLGFVPDTVVRVSAHEDVLTFTACGIGMDAYRQVVGLARKHKDALIYVQADKKYRDGLHLTLQSNWLQTKGFAPFDILMIKREVGCIKARRLPLDPRPQGGTRRLYSVTSDHKKSGKTLSVIRFTGAFLQQAHFTQGTVVSITCQSDMITLKRDQTGMKPKKLYRGCPPPCKIVKQCTVADEPFILLSGFWLQDLGFYPQDKIVVDCVLGVITIKRLDMEKLKS